MFGKSITGNVSTAAIAEELRGTAKVLPVTPVWYELEPNEWGDFGGEITTIAREPLSAGRQRKRGTITDFDASASFPMDITKTNFARLAQGFMFADIRQKTSTQPFDGTAIAVTGVDGSGAYSAASGLDAFPVGGLVYASGFGNPANNGLGRVTAAVAGSLTTSKITVVEAAPPATAKIELVGYQFAADDIAIDINGGLALLSSATDDFTAFDLNVGEWIFIGDGTDNSFASGKGYARIKTITEGELSLDKLTWDGAIDDTGAGKSIRIFFGNFLRNEGNAADIVNRSYQIERTLGSDDDGVQAEYVIGAVANELTVTFATADKLTAELAYVGMDSETRTGLEGLKSGTRVSSPDETAINTSTDVYRAQMTILDKTTLVPTTFFAYLNELTLSVNNNLDPVKVIGNLGAIDMTAGNFEVGGEATAIFTTVEAIRAVRRNEDVTLDVIVATDNAGMVFDIPLMGVGGGQAAIERDSPITVGLENLAAENENGYTFAMNFFPYLPDAAMGS